MKTFLDCIPCLVRQAFEAINFSTTEESIKEEIMRRCLTELSAISINNTPPHMATVIHRIVKERTGCLDPYKQIRVDSNTAALELYPRMKSVVENSPDRLRAAVHLAITGNVLDFGAPSRPGFDQLPEIISNMSSHPLHGSDIDILLEKIRNAGNILILGDNAGEIVFDRILLEELGPERCTYAVRGKPIINDSVYIDAEQSGLTDITRIIDNGSDAPGTILEWCSEDFIREFNDAELIIAKGQGNYETLSECARPDVFFLLKAKCPVIATHIGCNLGDYVVTSAKRSSR